MMHAFAPVLALCSLASAAVVEPRIVSGIKPVSIRPFTTTATSSTASPVASPYTQCGGIGYTGPVTCTPGYLCYYENPYFSVCFPPSLISSVSVPSTTTTPAPTTTSLSPSKVSLTIRPIPTCYALDDSAGTDIVYPPCGPGCGCYPRPTWYPVPVAERAAAPDYVCLDSTNTNIICPVYATD